MFFAPVLLDDGRGLVFGCMLGVDSPDVVDGPHSPDTRRHTVFWTHILYRNTVYRRTADFQIYIDIRSNLFIEIFGLLEYVLYSCISCIQFVPGWAGKRPWVGVSSTDAKPLDTNECQSIGAVLVVPRQYDRAETADRFRH